MRKLIIATGAVTIWLLIPTPVHAGGSVWHFEGYHRPGDVVDASTTAAWGHDPGLGTPADGPFLLYLVPADSEPDTFLGIPAEPLLVGSVHIDQSHRTPGTSTTALATAHFEIPSVPPGEYQIVHCNEPCTTTLGDIIGGWGLRVIGGDRGRPPEQVDADVRSSLGLEPIELAPANGGRLQLAWMAASGAVTAFMVVFIVRRHGIE